MIQMMYPRRGSDTNFALIVQYGAMLATLELRLCRSIQIRRYISKNTDRIGAEDEIPEDLIPFAAGRGRQERLDSLSLQILEERKMHAQRCDATFVSDKSVQELINQGFGQKQRLGEANNSLSAAGNRLKIVKRII